MEEKFNLLYAKEAEYKNVSAQAEKVHEMRLESEREAAKYRDMEAVK